MPYTTLIPAIKTILEDVTAVKSVYAYPLEGSPKVFPSVVFYPDNFENEFNTTQDNMKTYRFKLWVVVNLAGTNEEDVFTDILPNVVDKITDAFDAAWNGGTIDGHRIWQVISSGQWGFSSEEKAKEAYAELTLTVRMATST